MLNYRNGTKAGEAENGRNGGLEKAAVGDRKSNGGVPY